MIGEMYFKDEYLVNRLMCYFNFSRDIAIERIEYINERALNYRMIY
ncbi:hypothetical protein ACFJX3_08455 [Enterococcus faecalis]|nr:hypothetical protein [Enterococcus faecalis]EJM6269423.1 hypothetical protein [Enterococcus faecalis]NST97704.1 hypothetical protein [Enterococcus faecalis]HBI1661834.1 hypothetical protein [Enterococcus faecalis]HCT9190543.1 hypothetical protein [Enterococcus faecalis]